ncbi:MAG: tRNA (adenosine(37)-N6)-threonylcarbamoyltransferase complex transferase subunit TsaD, partial [Candidatus Omnitrophica bacterium]|nr:tRNA (adenosine(37)-N6)-threonylcarbamoyltransferase complex transferase subunit TsaD [Candidatus Omnitrophota bacterium]
LKVPIIGINHLQAHTFSPFIGKRYIPFPFISLVISGGHTTLALVKDLDRFEPLGQTKDDAIGEAFDKVSKILGFGYPGGHIIESLAKKGCSERVKLPYTPHDRESLNFSFSGIKTAVLYYVRDVSRRDNKINVFDLASSFQETVIKTVFEKLKLACDIKKIKTIVISGGVSINRRLREYFIGSSRRYGIKVIFPENNLCLDNAAMVASLGERLYKKKRYISNYYISALSSLGFNTGEGYVRFTVNN